MTGDFRRIVWTIAHLPASACTTSAPGSKSPLGRGGGGGAARIGVLPGFPVVGVRLCGGAIATAATHPAHGRETVASRHTWQVAMQVAAGRALHYAEQLRRKGKQVTISLPSATTARDILPTRPGETRPRTSHRDIASNNSRKLQQLGTQVKINVDTANAPQRLQHEAEAAARSGDLRAHVRVPGRAVHAIPLWDELRTWDPGD